jgi:hypothetical protein
VCMSKLTVPADTTCSTVFNGERVSRMEALSESLTQPFGVPKELVDHATVIKEGTSGGYKPLIGPTQRWIDLIKTTLLEC